MNGGMFSGPRLRFFAAAIVVINGFFPAVWILLTSFKTSTELYRKPITYFPQEPTLQNYITAAIEQPLFQVFMKNSVVVASLSTIVSLLVASFAAYAIARLNLKNRQLILTAIIASSMFPLVTLLVPLFETMRAFGWLNSYIALVLPYVVLNLPVCTLILVSFFQSIPRDLENAAMIDGCTRFGTLWRVVLPLSAPGVFTAVMTPSALAVYLYEFRIPFPVAVDAAGTEGPIPQTMSAYGMQGTPTTLLIDGAGHLRKVHFGVEPDEQVIADIDALIGELRIQ